MSELAPKDEHGCVKGKQRWNGTKCVAINPEKKVSEQATKETEIQGEPQSIKSNQDPQPKDWHKKREQYRAKMDSQKGEYKKPTVATHAVDKTYHNKPLSRVVEHLRNQQKKKKNKLSWER